MVMRKHEPDSPPVKTPNPNAAIESCADYLERIHFWIQLWSILTLTGIAIMMFNMMGGVE